MNQALTEVVNFASWSYGQHLQETLGNGAREVLGAVNHGDNVHTGRNIPPANELVHYLCYSQQCLCLVPRPGPVPANFLPIKLGSDRLDVATNTLIFRLKVGRSTTRCPGRSSPSDSGTTLRRRRAGSSILSPPTRV